MIYYIDEELNRNKSKIRFLRLHGYNVTHCHDATEAWHVLYSAKVSDIDLIIVDVMLAAGSRYEQARTHDYLTTGLELVKDLLSQRKDLSSSKVLLFTASTRPDIIGFVQALASETGVLYKAKSDFDTVYDFLAFIETICPRRDNNRMVNPTS